jgi:pyrroloquinoline quinone biosynthesis protein B
LRKGTINAKARTQSSIAISGDNTNWVLFNASPDILTQFRGFPELQPARAIRDTAVRSVVLMDAQIDHTTGLLMLREGKTPLDIYCTDMAYEDLTTGNPLLKILEHYCGVNWHRIPTQANNSFEAVGIEGLEFTAVPLSSKAPPYSPHRHDPHEGDNIGMRVIDTRSGKNLFYAPGLGEIESHVKWTNDEMAALGIANKMSLDMGHLPQSGPGGMMEVLRPLKASRKILIHINNTNPILREDSDERRQLEAEKIEVSYDGMDITV